MTVLQAFTDYVRQQDIVFMPTYVMTALLCRHNGLDIGNIASECPLPPFSFSLVGFSASYETLEIALRLLAFMAMAFLVRDCCANRSSPTTLALTLSRYTLRQNPTQSHCQQGTSHQLRQLVSMQRCKNSMVRKIDPCNIALRCIASGCSRHILQANSLPLFSDALIRNPQIRLLTI